MPSSRNSLELIRLFPKFFQNYKTCPVCGTENHENFLKTFFTSKDKDKIAYRDLLLDMMDKHRLEQKRNIRLGIPCCDCFKEVFPKPHIEMDDLRAQCREILGQYNYSVQEKAIKFYLDLLEFDPNLDFGFIAYKLEKELTANK